MYELLRLACTVPLTSVVSERQFSALKRIKSVRRTNIGQEQLKQLMFLSVEQKVLDEAAASSNFKDKVIDHFDAAANRKLNLQFK